MKRILVIGTSGTGKSTLAQQLSTHLRLPFFASDQFYWESDWRVSSPERVRQQVSDVVDQEIWILDGNFDDERELVWKRADSIIWLDYSLMTIFLRIASRNFWWTITRKPTWSGNRMTLSRAISGIRHAIKSHPKKRQNYPSWLSEFPDITIYRFYTSIETEAWLQGLSQQVG